MTDIGTFILAALKNTPWWSWALLAYLIVQGVRAMRGGETSFARLSAMPIIFAVWGLWSVFALFQASMSSLIVWAVSFFPGGGLGFLRAAAMDIRTDRTRQVIILPGSAMALVSSLLIFAVKYTLAVMMAVQRDIVGATWFLIVDVGVTGLVAGLFAGRLLGLWRKYEADARRPAQA